MAIAKSDSHAAGFIAALEATGLTVGDNFGEGLAPPFAVVRDISDSTSGSFANPAEDTAFVYQVTCVGRKPMEARNVRDKAMDLVGDSTVTVAGRSTRVYKQDGSGPMEPEEEVVIINGRPTRFFYYTPRFVLMSFPA